MLHCRWKRGGSDPGVRRARRANLNWGQVGRIARPFRGRFARGAQCRRVVGHLAARFRNVAASSIVPVVVNAIECDNGNLSIFGQYGFTKSVSGKQRVSESAGIRRRVV